MPDIQHLIQIEAEPDAVYRAVTTEDGLRGWWTADVEAEAVEGGHAQFGFFKRATVYRMRIDRLEPPEELRWTCETGGEWKDTTVEFRMQPADGGTKLTFRHADWREATDYYWSCNTTWGALMYRLKGVAEGKQPGPLFTEDSLAY